MCDAVPLRVYAAEGSAFGIRDRVVERGTPPAIERPDELKNPLDIRVLERPHAPGHVRRNGRARLRPDMGLNDFCDDLLYQAAQADNQVLGVIRLDFYVVLRLRAR